jgi:predicted ATPase
MRLKYLYINDYKNLKDLSISFDSDSFIDIFVGKNGSGKSNVLEALVEVFRHLYEQSSSCQFEYKIGYVLDGADIFIEWKGERFYLDNKGKGVKTFSTVPLPDNVLIYYSGHNKTVANLIDRYEASFKKKILGANLDDTRRFIGIGPDSKALLLTILLLQPDGCRAKKFIFQKLGITVIEDTIELELTKPRFAESRLKKLGIEAIEDFDQRSHFWGADGITGEFLEKLKSSIKGEYSHSTIYDSKNDSYTIPVNVGLFQKLFEDSDISEQFRLLDNLKTLEMLGDINIAMTLTNGNTATLNYFSDGQLQSVYIYAVTEIFKDKECITLLDEPDSFLHPEWQFDFLKQVFDISEEAKKTNHILMSSHSASTVTSAEENTINLFNIDGGNTVVNKVSKAEVIKSLSAGLISFSEAEISLSIHRNIRNNQRPVVFVEGITDETILSVAWNNLFPGEELPFDIQNAFDRIFLRNLFSRDDLQINYPGRKMFALFDFDEAYDDWNGLKGVKKDQLEEACPMKGLAKQLKYQNHYAMLLPVPEIDALKPQVLDPNGDPWGRGVDSHISIELLFFKDEMLGTWFKKCASPGGGEIIEFSGDKVSFAEKIIPRLPTEAFEVFRSVFDFVTSKLNPT